MINKPVSAESREDSLKANDHGRPSGILIVNADDWGRDRENTDATLDCVRSGALSSVSAMVFMEDSERSAGIALEHGVDAGLHLNFTTPFSAPSTPARLAEYQRRLTAFLLRHRLAPAVYHPGLVTAFEYVMKAQRDEFCRLFGFEPARLDGHHHMHLCSNVILAGLLPVGTIVRRNFSFGPGEKSFVNRLYRRVVDQTLARHHSITDYFFSLPPMEPLSRLERIFSLATRFSVEVETHPVRSDEHEFLTNGKLIRLTETVNTPKLRIFPASTSREIPLVNDRAI